MYETRLYFEAHVTIAPVFDELRDKATRVAKKHGFRLANLIMRKTIKEEEKESQDDTFMTATGIEFETIHSNMVNLIKEMKSDGFKVYRYKIENTLLDSRFEDSLRLLDDNRLSKDERNKRGVGHNSEDSEGIQTV